MQNNPGGLMNLPRGLRRAIPVVGLLLLGLTQPALSQQKGSIEITPTFGYQWGGSVQGYEGEVALDDGAQYGLMLGYRVQKELVVEFFWSYLPTVARFEPYYLTTVDPSLIGQTANIGVHYFQLNALYEMGRGKTKPFLGAGAGIVMFSPEDSKYETDVYAAMNFSGGVKIYLSEKLGLRLQGRLLMPLYVTGGGFYVGTGGTGMSVGAGIPIVQGDLSAGLMIII
jgi:hypothetical protein